MDVRLRNNVTFAGVDSGPTVVLAHGFGCDQNLWRLIVSRLQDDFRLVLFDHVGSGHSDPNAWDADRYSSLRGYAVNCSGAHGVCRGSRATQSLA